ncbi:spore gernimation protein GerT [Bacillus carboniphilus]|uniref:Spore gernimation protein GerT n=1 Tax=Bacillus carboniphilus TaxID=86663 RepID=A0ABY9JVA6_9BACI|nr:spore gernimation protein GerT [Bacillus carboniphilus]WLR43341.1 spore gernimation protein GerT [Bacillus carboniphilus]
MKNPWDQFFPFEGKNNFTDMLNNMDPNDVENYVQQIMKKVFGENQFSDQFPFNSGTFNPIVNNSQTRSSKIEIFNMKDHIYVKVPLNVERANHLKIQHSSYELILHNYPDEGETTTQILPSAVRRKGTKVSREENHIEIRFIKRDDIDYTEIEIAPQD